MVTDRGRLSGRPLFWRSQKSLFKAARAVTMPVMLAQGMLVLILSVGSVTTPPPALMRSQRAQPLDPLTPAELQLAADIAKQDVRVRNELRSNRYRLIQVQFVAPKTAVAQMDRYAAVLFFRYDTNEAFEVTVNLTRQSTGAIVRRPGQGVPLALDEIKEAFALALKNQKLRTLLGPRVEDFGVVASASDEAPDHRVEGFRVIAASRRDPCYRHRCVELHFRRPDGYVPDTSVTVDLTARKITVNHPVR
jgi:hypothetical protein